MEGENGAQRKLCMKTFESALAITRITCMCVVVVQQFSNGVSENWGHDTKNTSHCPECATQNDILVTYTYRDFRLYTVNFL